jgi:hypothetical protein
MLTHVDVLLGVAMVMLGVSLLLTIVTQIVSFAANLRGAQLKVGLVELFEVVKIENPGPLVDSILHHKLIADGVWRRRLAPAISKLDLLTLLDGAQEYLEQTGPVATALKQKKDEVETWFDATMSRVANRFTMQTRIVTIIGAVLAAFLLHLDAFGLVSRLYADSDLRAKMAGAAGALVTQSEVVLATPTVFTDVAASLAKKNPDVLSPKPFQSRDQVKAWIQASVADPNRAQVINGQFDLLLTEAVRPAFKQWIGEATDINDQLSAAGFELVQKPWDPFHYDSAWVFLGVLASAALLSLGAPFWFNALKTLSNLRPAIAAAVEDRDQGGQPTQS